MSYPKSEKKKAYIIKKAKDVFMKKGFTRVTMKDIIVACNISRGGLYLYFDSTRTIFLEVFKRESILNQEFVTDALKKKQRAKDVLLEYIDQYRNAILGKKPSLSLATYEFFRDNEEEQVIRQWQFDDLSEMFRELLEYGIRDGDFKNVNTALWGRHFVHTLNGMCLTVPILRLPEQRIDEELNLLLESVMK